MSLKTPLRVGNTGAPKSMPSDLGKHRGFVTGTRPRSGPTRTHVKHKARRYVPNADFEALTRRQVEDTQGTPSALPPLINAQGRTQQEQDAYDKQLAEHRARRERDLAWMTTNKTR